MTTLIAIYLLFGVVSYWPMVYFWLDKEELDNGQWHHWAMAWAMWCVSWPYWNAMNAWYWWRAKK
jgi:hypothetical protein